MKNKKNKIYCARCKHLKVVEYRSFREDPVSFYYMVKCEKKGWQKKSGETQMYKYLTVWRREKECCEHYEDIKELPEDYIKKLRSKLQSIMSDVHREPTDQTTDDLLFRGYAMQPFSRVL